LARKILLADDSVTAQNMGRKILADAGYEVTTVNNGSAALKKIAELKPELVILDVYMPGYSGLEVCQRLKEAAETARLPVLLSVGKLEPFKPEESQRVRADAFIVKPFEASELLSALAKLEDKVVPRPEPSKPGRFARAFAAIEESASGPRHAGPAPENAIEDNAIQETGWKSRIGFPHKKSAAEAEGSAAGEDAIYNPVNRDLRTVVETPAEHAAEAFSRQKNAPQPHPAEETQASESSDGQLDLAALVPPGLPKDVTPEEVAAIAAASVQIQRAAAAAKEEPAAEEASTFGSAPASPAAHDFVVSPSAFTDQDGGGFAVAAAQAHSLLDAIKGQAAASDGVVPEVSALSSPAAGEKAQEQAPEKVEERVRVKENLEDGSDGPVTMASASPAREAASDAGQWKAVPTALAQDESNLTLEEEMRKAYAAFVREENHPSVEPQPESTAQETANAQGSNLEAASQEISTVGSPLMVDSTETKAAPEIMGAEAPLEREPDSSSQMPQFGEPTGSPLREPELEPAVTAALPEPMHPESVPSESLSSEATPSEATPCGTALEQVEPLAPIPDAGLIVAETAASNHAFVSVVHQAGHEPGHESRLESEPMDESESVRSTAAAWESWRRLNEAGEAKAASPDDAYPQPAAADAPAEAAAMAVAAGAEQAPLPDVTDAASTEVASIVEGLLADLRPRLMAEISRKMAEKK
jgi:CheY-like chemotaxis protein